jgi:hypothetical protein
MRPLLLLALLAATPALAGELPDASRTPGATNPDITQANIGKTVCARGKWSTKSIRPPASYTNRLKKQQLSEYGYSDTSPQSYEEDHLIPLTVGGNPRDPRNLWPEPWDGEWGAHVKDRLEVKLNKLVCNGTLTLKAAQQEIRTDWIAAYKKYVGTRP